MDTNEEIERAAKFLSGTVRNIAALLDGVVRNNPELPEPFVGADGQTVWLSPLGVPDFTYAPALALARETNRSADALTELLGDIQQNYQQGPR